MFGCHTLESLNYTAYYIVSQQFGTRGRQEHHRIRIEDLKWVKDPDTDYTIYIEWIEGITKTRKGGLQKAERALKQRMFATGGPRCPVGIMEAMIAKRPDELKNTGPLYLRPLPQPKGAVWYSKQPVGTVNTINRYMKDIAEKAGLGDSGKNITNHSTRKTLVKKLKKAGVDGRNIAAITGHKTEESLRDYDENDLEDHRRLSTFISGDGSSTPKQDAIASITDVHLPSLYSSPAGTSSHHYSPVSYFYNMSYCPAFYPPEPTPHNQFMYCNIYL